MYWTGIIGIPLYEGNIFLQAKIKVLVDQGILLLNLPLDSDTPKTPSLHATFSSRAPDEFYKHGNSNTKISPRTQKNEPKFACVKANMQSITDYEVNIAYCEPQWMSDQAILRIGENTTYIMLLERWMIGNRFKTHIGCTSCARHHVRNSFVILTNLWWTSIFSAK